MPEAADIELFCRSEWPRLVGSLFLVTGSRDLSEELAQETLARVWRDWRRVSKLERPGAWAHRVALNLVRSHFRRRSVARRREPVLAVGDRSPEPDTATAFAVRHAVLELPDRERIVLALRYFADLSVADTADAMRCPEGTVKTLTRQALARLRATGLVTDDDEESMTDVR